MRAVRAEAFLDGRGYVTPQDVKSAAPDVLRHRLLVSYEAEAEELKAEDLLKLDSGQATRTLKQMQQVLFHIPGTEAGFRPRACRFTVSA